MDTDCARPRTLIDGHRAFFCDVHLLEHLSPVLDRKRGIRSKDGSAVLNKRPGRPRRTDDRYINSQGYVWIRVDDNFVAEHRYVMEQLLGRKLVKGENIHHKNGVRHDNRVENLELWVKTQPCGYRVTELCCAYCGGPYL